MSTTLISVANMRSVVSRQHPRGNGFDLEAAANWEDLEDEAVQAVLQAGGGVNLSGLYPCPPDLAERARWRVGGPRGGGKKPTGKRLRERQILVRVFADEYDEMKLAFFSIRDGEAAVIEVDDEFDPALVRWLREQAAGMDPTDYLPDALLGIAACIEAALDRKRRREREEMDALNAEANPRKETEMRYMNITSYQAAWTWRGCRS